jgi:hypothetical protein
VHVRAPKAYAWFRIGTRVIFRNQVSDCPHRACGLGTILYIS